MGRGLDAIQGPPDESRNSKRIIIGLGVFATLLCVCALFLQFGSRVVVSLADGVINQPTRYQSDTSLIVDRYVNMIREAWLATGIACTYLVFFTAWFWRKLSLRWLYGGLFVLLLLDLWRVNDRFLILCPAPATDKKKDKTDVVSFLEKNIGNYRMQPLGGRDPFYYSDFKLPNIAAYVTISERRYKEFLDSFSLAGVMPDIINLKYLVVPVEEYKAQKGAFDGKYDIAFTSVSTNEVVLENRTVLPKVWLVPSVAVVTNVQQRLAIMASPEFKPSSIAIVESTPPIVMAVYSQRPAAGIASIEKYSRNQIVVTTKASENTLLVLGEKYYTSWRAEIDGKRAAIQPANHILRGVYVPSGEHRVAFEFHSTSFENGKYLTLASFAFFAALFAREWFVRRRDHKQMMNG
jgi:hypothetical protein